MPSDLERIRLSLSYPRVHLRGMEEATKELIDRARSERNSELLRLGIAALQGWRKPSDVAAFERRLDLALSDLAASQRKGTYAEQFADAPADVHRAADDAYSEAFEHHARRFNLSGSNVDFRNLAGEHAALQVYSRWERERAAQQAQDALGRWPIVVVQSLLIFGAENRDGRVVEAVTPAWLEIIRHIGREPNDIHALDWRKLEELIAGAYRRHGWTDVTLTPRSGDDGRDVVATLPGIVPVRVVDQIKAYRQGHRVTADEVRSMIGVLEIEKNVSKAVVSTTSEFAPGIERSEKLSQFVPYRLELRNRDKLLHFLRTP